MSSSAGPWVKNVQTSTRRPAAARRASSAPADSTASSRCGERKMTSADTGPHRQGSAGRGAPRESVPLLDLVGRQTVVGVAPELVQGLRAVAVLVADGADHEALAVDRPVRVAELVRGLGCELEVLERTG